MAGDKPDVHGDVEDSDRTSSATKWMEVLKVVAMPLVTLFVGLLFNQGLDSRQSRENNLRLYAEMMGRREEADSALRKDMFNSMLSTFMPRDPKLSVPMDERLRQDVLSLELLAYNFHDSLDLAPLFKDVRQRIDDRETKTPTRSNDPGEKQGTELKKRLEQVAREVIVRQLTALSDSGTVVRGDGILQKLKDGKEYLRFDGGRDVTGPNDSGSKAGESTSLLCLTTDLPDVSADPSDAARARHYRQFKLELIDYDAKWGVRVRLYVSKILSAEECHRTDLDLLAIKEIQNDFWIDQFDFPLIDNTRLTYGERCAVAVTQPIDDQVAVALAYFPGSRASLREKPYYDEVMRNLVQQPRTPPVGP